MTVSLYFCDPWWKIFGQRRNSEDLKNKIEANSVICCKIWDSFGCRKYCQYYWFGTKMLRSKTDLFSFRSYIYHMTKWTKYIFLRMDWTFLLLTGTFWGGLGMKGVFGLSNNTVFITWISLFWKEIYISRQLNLFLRTMFVVVGLSFVTTTLNG